MPHRPTLALPRVQRRTLMRLLPHKILLGRPSRCRPCSIQPEASSSVATKHTRVRNCTIAQPRPQQRCSHPRQRAPSFDCAIRLRTCRMIRRRKCSVGLEWALIRDVCVARVLLCKSSARSFRGLYCRRRPRRLRGDMGGERYV